MATVHGARGRAGAGHVAHEALLEKPLRRPRQRGRRRQPPTRGRSHHESRPRHCCGRHQGLPITFFF